MIRILHYGISSNLGGIETYLWNLATTIDRERFHFDFLHSDTGRPPALERELSAMGSVFHKVTPRRVSPGRNRREVASIVTPSRADILHFHANTASYLAPVRAALRSGMPVIVHSHNAGASSGLTRLLHRANRLTLPWKRVTQVAVSEEAGRWMFPPAGRYRVVPNGIVVDDFVFQASVREANRQALGIGDRLVIGHVGAFLPAKNHQLLISAFREVRGREASAVLLLVGAGPLEAAVRSTVRQLGLEESVRFLGRREDVPDLLAAMDCFLLPSRHEGFSLVTLEAQASGLPCVVSEAVPPVVAVTPAVRRLPVDASPVAWADAVESVAPSAQRELGGDLVRQAGFSVEANTAAVAGLYDGLIRGADA